MSLKSEDLPWAFLLFLTMGATFFFCVSLRPSYFFLINFFSSSPRALMDRVWWTDFLSLAVSAWLFYYLFKNFSKMHRRDTVWKPLAVFGLLLAVLWSVLVFSSQSHSIDGQRVWWLNDDAMASMRYAFNLAEGKGLVWNAGERVEGYSNFWWVLMMAGVHGLGIKTALTSLLVLVFDLLGVFVLLSVFANLFVRGGHRHGGFLALALAFFVFNLEFFEMFASGLESLAMVLLWLWSYKKISAELSRGKFPAALWWLTAGLLGLLRADGPVWIVALLAALCIQPHWKISFFKSAGWLIFPWLLQLGFRLFYFGHWQPNTALLKLQAWDLRWLAGLEYGYRFLLDYWFVLILALGACFLGPLKAMPLRRGLAAASLVLGLYGVWAGGDFMPTYRFIALVPFSLLLLSIWFLESLSQMAGQRILTMVLSLGLFLFIPNLLYNFDRFLSPSEMSLEQVEMGMKLKKYSNKKQSLGSAWAGRVFYFSQLRGVDFLGKMDPVIAGQAAAAGNKEPGHHKYNFEYSLNTKKPDFVHANLLANGSRRKGLSGYRLALIRNDFFLKKCLPHPVMLGEANTVWRCR